MAAAPGRPIRDLFGFAVVTAAAALSLAVLNALPSLLGGEPRGVVRYDSVAQLDRVCRTTLWQPRALAEPWRWPPRRVRAALGERDWVQYEFGNGLTVCQACAPTAADAPVPRELLPAGEVLQTEDAVLDGRPVRLRRLLLGDGTIAHELWWQAGGRPVMLRLRGTLAALRTIADNVGSAQ